MKHIAIIGRRGAASVRARDAYTSHTQQGRHTLLDEPGNLMNSLPERRPSAADVLITVKFFDQELTETTTP